MQPTRHYGIFADDPEALKLCDEIEEEIYKHFIELLQSLLPTVRLGNSTQYDLKK